MGDPVDLINQLAYLLTLGPVTISKQGTTYRLEGQGDVTVTIPQRLYPRLTELYKEYKKQSQKK